MFEKRRVVNWILPLVLLGAGSSGFAATLGQWSGNAQAGVWASTGNFSTIYASATVGSLGYTIEGRESITPSHLDNNSHFLIANPSYAPTSVEMANLINWVYQGGILILAIDPYSIVDTNTYARANPAAINTILAALGPGNSGSQMKIQTPYVGGGSQMTTGYLTGTDPAVSGLTGAGHNMLALYQSYTVTGGQFLATNPLAYSLGNTLRYDTFQLGKVYVLGDRFDQNGLMNGVGSNNQFFLNLLGQSGYSGGPDSIDNPEPATLGLTGLALLGLAAFTRRRGRSRLHG